MSLEGQRNPEETGGTDTLIWGELWSSKSTHCALQLDIGIVKICSFVFKLNSLIPRKPVNFTNSRGAGHGAKNGSTT